MCRQIYLIVSIKNARGEDITSIESVTCLEENRINNKHVLNMREVSPFFRRGRRRFIIELCAIFLRRLSSSILWRDFEETYPLFSVTYQAR